MVVTLSFNLTLLYVFAANVIAILIYVLLIKQRARRLRRSVEAISAVIVDYFQADGINVRVECLPSRTGKGFIAFIESEPMKRFRYSNIIENSLRLHVRRMCKEDLDRIFWRFPFDGKNRAAEKNADEMDVSDDKHDEYIREGLEAIKKKSAYDIREGSWEEFEDTVIKIDTGKKPKKP